jgi:hypothetical protein
MKNRATEVAAEFSAVEDWRDILLASLNGALTMDGIKLDERKDIEVAARCIASVDHLAKIIDRLPYSHEQAYAFSQLRNIMGAAFVAGKCDSESPTTKKLTNKWAAEQAAKQAAQSIAHARKAKPSTKHRDKIDEVVGQCSKDHKNSMRQNANAKALDILTAVNSELAKLKIKPLTHNALRKKISSLKLAG